MKNIEKKTENSKLSNLVLVHRMQLPDERLSWFLQDCESLSVSFQPKLLGRWRFRRRLRLVNLSGILDRFVLGLLLVRKRETKSPRVLRRPEIKDRHTFSSTGGRLLFSSSESSSNLSSQSSDGDSGFPASSAIPSGWFWWWEKEKMNKPTVQNDGRDAKWMEFRLPRRVLHHLPRHWPWQVSRASPSRDAVSWNMLTIPERTKK